MGCRRTVLVGLLGADHAGVGSSRGVSLPHYSVAQYQAGTPITAAQLRPGDLVFWSSSSSPSGIHHVALYAGDQMIVHAPRTGRPVVRSRCTPGPRRHSSCGSRPPRRPVPGTIGPMTLDVAALTALLDGDYADVRTLVRENLAEHASVLVDAEEMSRDDFRQRVLDVVMMMAEHRPDRLRLPQGLRRRRGRRRLGRRLRDPGARRPLGGHQGRRPVRAVRRGPAPARHRAPPRCLPRGHDQRPAARLLRDDRVRSRLQRPGARHHRDLRRGLRRVRRAHARRPGPQGLHRRRRPARPARGGVRPARRRR